MTGSSADALEFYEEHDHLLVAVERGGRREDWRGLPTLTPHETAFDSVLRDTSLPEGPAKTKINELFVKFDSDLDGEPDLTQPDKERIRGEVIAELESRVKRKFGAIFQSETRSVAGIQRSINSEGFDFLDVGDGGPEAAKPAQAGALPF